MSLDSNFNFGTIDNEYNQLLSQLHSEYCLAQPEDVLQFCANFFNRKLEEERVRFRQVQQGIIAFEDEQHPLAAVGPGDSTSFFFSNNNNKQEEEHYEYTDDEQDERRDTIDSGMMPLLNVPSYSRDRRTSVSAESMAPGTNEFVKKLIPKTPEQCERIRVSVANNFLFRNLDEEQYQEIVDAMEEKHARASEVVIEQGAVGDFFYVVESGTFDCYISKNNEPPVKVTSYEAGGCFGELALMYNAPRAATIIATSDAVLWALDRVTFRTILMENTSRKRRMYESFLRDVPLLKSLEPYEILKIADALESVYFEDGEKVIVQGDVGDRFYIIEAGEALVYKTDENGVEHQVNALGRAAYFGELALLNDSPRLATVTAHGRLKCVTLGKKAFTRLLGPVMDILERNTENYRAIISQHPSL